MIASPTFPRFVVSLLFAAALLPAAEPCKDKCGQIQVGQPKLWSLSEAQYLIGKMRDSLKDLTIALPNGQATAGTLDPNAINLQNLDIILQSLAVKAQFDPAVPLNNAA